MSADIVRAHGHLAAIDPQGTGDALLFEILDALLLGAGCSRGVILDDSRPRNLVSRGLPGGPETFLPLTTQLGDRRLDSRLISAEACSVIFGTRIVPFLVPLTAGDETLAILLTETPPQDPSGFASVTAHAASIMAWVRNGEKVRRTDFELKYRVWELESLYDVGLSIAGTLDLESLADDILLKSISLLNARSGTLIVWEPGGEEAILQKDFGSPLLDPHAALLLPDEILVANTRAERAAALAQAPAEKLLSVPIRSDNKCIGVLVVADKENRAGGVDNFVGTDARTLSLFGNQAAIALENARLHRESLEKERMEREIELAASIQRTILPESLPWVSGLELAGDNRPTRQVGGDYFDVFPLPGGRSVLVVADVSGKGVPAALLVSTVHACLHLLVETPGLDLPALVKRVNRHLIGFSSTRRFVTLFLALFEPETRRLRYVNAGHNPGIVRSGGAFRLLPSSGVPIGMLPNVTHEEASLDMLPGDLVVLYSDGITEAQTVSEEEFGMERLENVILRSETLPAALVTRQIFAEVSEFTRGAAQYDDQTVLVARVL